MKTRYAIVALFAACALSLSVVASVAMADTTIAETGEGAGQVSGPAGLAVDTETGRLYVADSGNRRIDAFDAAGNFEFAWGWGVADGSPEAQTCGPEATPPTVECRRGIPGGGAGQFPGSPGFMGDIAVDNDPASPSHHAVYVVDSTAYQNNSVRPTNSRVQKFDSEGNFLLAFGGGVVDGGASGTGRLTSGSTTVANVVTTEKAFRVSQRITGTGIPAGTVILAVGNGTLTLSKPATATASGVALEVPEGPGNVPVNEVQEIVARSPFGIKAFGWNAVFRSPAPDGIAASTEAKGEALLHPESTSVTEVSTSDGAFMPGKLLICCGGAGPTRAFREGETAILSFNPGAGTMTLSQPTNPVVPNTKVEIWTGLPLMASSALVEAALEGMPNLTPDEVAVSGPNGGPYLVAFGGARYEDTNLDSMSAEGVVTRTQGGSGAEVCTAANAWSCASGVEGSEQGQFAISAQLAIGPGGTVYVADSSAVQGGGVESFDNRLQTFTPAGVAIDEIALPDSGEVLTALAVEPDGEFYVVAPGGDGAQLQKFDPAGSPLGSEPAPSGTAVALDGGDIFSLERDDGWLVIAQRDAAGETLRRFGYGMLGGGISGIAPYQGPGGDIYAVDSNGFVVHLSFPAPGPIVPPEPCKAQPVGNTKATLRASVNPEGKATTFHYEYVDQASYEAEGFASPNTIESPESASVGSDFALKEAVQQVDVLPETTYRCRVVAQNEDLAGVTGPVGTFTTLPPFEIIASSAGGVRSDRATLSASVNPLGSPVTGWFEWVDEETFQQSGFADAARLPVAPAELDFGSGESPKAVSAELTGLLPGTRYRFRLAVDAQVIAVRYGPTQSFRTRLPGEDEAPDERRYELVSDDEGTDAEIATPTAAGGGVEGIRAVAPSGEAVAFASFTAFADPEGAPTPSQYLARRGATDWTTENLNLPGLVARFGLPQQGFTADLGHTASLLFEPPLTPDCAAGFENLYWRDTQTGEVDCLTAGTPQSSAKFCPVLAGASADGSQVYFAANGSLAGAPKGNGWSLYRWSGGVVSLVSVLPNGSSALPRTLTGFGAATNGEGLCNSLGSLNGAVSSDGLRSFWHYGTEFAGSSEPLLASTVGSPTVQLDAVQGGSGPGGKGTFRGASSDGQAAFLTAPGQLTAGASGGTDLYRYDFGSAPGSRLEDLTPGALTPGSEAAAVQGVLATSSDGQRAYFAANGVLTGSQANAEGAIAQAGKPNLYLWQQGEGVRFIATLAAADPANWSLDTRVLSAAATPSGSHLAFLSAASLTGYDNTDPGSGNPRREVFLYDVEADQLSCASCNPTGEQPAGNASLPAWTNPLIGPRYLSDDGNRLFFETADDLAAADENGKLDVYEFERPGTGTCTAQSGTYDEDSGGCLYLLSGGQSDDDSYLLGASGEGRDVFFSTRETLLWSDSDQRYDVYDYRVGGFPPPSPPPPPCEGEACRPPAGGPPQGASPSTPSFVGPGNEAAKTCPKGKVRRKGRCVRKPCPKGKVRRKGRCVRKHQGKTGNGKSKHGKDRGAGR